MDICETLGKLSSSLCENHWTFSFNFHVSQVIHLHCWDFAPKVPQSSSSWLLFDWMREVNWQSPFPPITYSVASYSMQMSFGHVIVPAWKADRWTSLLCYLFAIIVLIIKTDMSNNTSPRGYRGVEDGTMVSWWDIARNLGSNKSKLINDSNR